MATFARLNDANEVLEKRNFPEGFTPPDLPQKGWRWVPYVETEPTPFDERIQDRQQVDVVTGSAVERQWIVTDLPVEPIRESAIERIKNLYRVGIVDALPDMKQVEALAGERDVLIAELSAKGTAAEIVSTVAATVQVDAVR